MHLSANLKLKFLMHLKFVTCL